MKTFFKILLVMLTFGYSTAYGQAKELQQLALNIEKLAQFKQILKDMKAGYQILTDGYGTVKDLTQGNFTLHELFLDALLQVSPAVRNYRRVADIATLQVALVQESNRALQRWRGAGLFNPDELAYMERVYDRLIDDSLRNLDELLGILTAGEMRMSDSERLEGIDAIYTDLQDKVTFLRDFNSNTSVLALQRAKEQHDVDRIRDLQ